MTPKLHWLLRIGQTSALVLLACIPLERQSVRASHGFQFEGAAPFNLLARLIREEDRGNTTLHLSDAPRGWIHRNQIELLIRLMDSNEPCAGIHSGRDSYLPIGGCDKPRSTVGHEAAFLIEGYRHGLYPKSAKYSVDWPIDHDEIKRWWSKGQDK